MADLQINSRHDSNKTPPPRRAIRVSRFPLILSLVVLLTSQHQLCAQPADKPASPQQKQPRKSVNDLPLIVRERLQLESPPTDKLLYGLEKDFVELLKTAGDPQALLEAEQLLEATNDNSRWTNYSAATRILRAHREKAAIPLLLRYIVLHAERSSCHVMIPEYAKTISVISGCQLDSPYEAGPNQIERMRVKVGQLVETWWSKEKDNIETSVDKLSSDIRRNPSRHPILLLGTLAEYKNDACREILAAMLQESLKGGTHTIDLYRILSAFETACGQRWQKAGAQTDDQRQEIARLALAWYREHVSDTKLQLRVLTAQFESATTQLEVGLTIEAVRHKEYKRLLGLQGDAIVTAEQSNVAHERLINVRAEVKTARAARDKAEAALETLKSELK